MASETNNEVRPFKRRKLDYAGNPVTVVLKDDKHVTVQHTVLCKSSAYFQTALGGDRRETNVGLITLQDCEQHEFLTYLHWLYTGELDLTKEEDPTIKSEKPEKAPRSLKNVIITQAVRSYIFGDFVSDLRFRNALIDKLLTTPFFPDPSFLARFWSKIPPLSGFGRLLADIYAFNGGYHAGGHEDVLDRCPPDFVLSVTKAIFQQRRMGIVSKAPREQAKCHYHDHKDDADKCQD